MEIKTVSLKDYTSLKIGGDAKLVKVTTQKDLIEALFYAKHEGFHVHILGAGTNTFFGTSLQNIFVIEMAMKGISYEEREESVLITAYSGEVWDDLVKFSVEKGLWGIENLSYIPGTVGASPVQNIGAYGTSLADVFISLSAVDLLTLDIVTITKEACAFGYRDSLFKKRSGRYAIITVTIILSKTSDPVLSYKPLDTLIGKEGVTLQEIRAMVIKTRKAKLPDYNVYPNAGSFFKNPIITEVEKSRLVTLYTEMPYIQQDNGYKVPSAWLIEHVAQSKGVRVGDVGTWPVQPLVIVNYGEADAEDVLNFSDEIILRIQEKTGITLEREVNCVLEDKDLIRF